MSGRESERNKKEVDVIAKKREAFMITEKISRKPIRKGR